MFVWYGSRLVSQVDNGGAGHVIVSLLVVEKVRTGKALLVVGVLHLLAVHVLGAVEPLAVLAVANITVGPFVFTMFTTSFNNVRRR